MDGVVDMFSKLPDPILELILSGLPTTEEVIRTSILSKRWRYLWTSIPSIDIDYSRRPIIRDYVNEINKFEEFVYWILSGRSLDLDSFRLHCPRYYSVPRVWRWIRMAIIRKVKQVDLMFGLRDRYEDEGIEVPYCLLTCPSLEVLRLSLDNNRLTLPFLNSNFTVFPALRVLELNSLELTDGGLLHQFLERSCPCLEELSFIQCILFKLGYLSISCPNLKKLTIDNRNNYTWINGYLYHVWAADEIPAGFLYSGVWISCPKLVFFEFAGHVAHCFSFQTTLHSLKKAVIHLEDLDDQHKISYDTLFAQISHAEYLSLSHYFIKELDVQAVSLPNLKTLELTTTLDADIMDVLIKFLICVPHLESLHLIILEEYSTDKHWNLHEAEARRVLAPRLKRVEFLEFNGRKRKLDLARSLLKHGNVLEEMVFNWVECRRNKSMYTMKKVSRFRKASSTVKLITLLKD